MKNIIILFLILVSVGCSKTSSGETQPAITYDSALEKEVKRIVSGLSLEEKVGQMCQVTIEELQCDSLVDGEVILDSTKINKVIRDFKVGSVLNVPMGKAQTKETWCRIIGGIQKASMEYIGIPDIYGVDQNHGSTYTLGGTMFPQEINMAASLNKGLVREAAKITAYEARACDIPWVFNPVMDLGRNPAWSRIWESFGEDPYINSAMAVEMVKGYQGEDNNHLGSQNVGACLKHYMAYGNPTSGKDRTPASINRMDLREKYFAPYKAAIRAGALSVMVNSAQVNGLPMHVNHELLTVWLKEELDWDGMIVSDWADIHNIWKRDRVAADYKEAIEKAINAGIDMSMTPNDVEFCTLLKELIEEGKVPMSRVDDAVSRIIRFKLRLGLFETPNTFYNDYPLFGSEEFAQKALMMANESEILLKNEGGILPLPVGKRILVTGPNANSMRSLNGGWSYTWQGSNDSVFHHQYNTIYEAICQEFGENNVILEQGMDYVEDFGKWDDLENIRIESAVEAASRADVIIACVGENSYCETVGNLKELTLAEEQRNLVKALSKTGKPIILVLNEGRPRIIRDIEPFASAVIDILLPGNYGGDALAQLLSGKNNFSGRLPYTYPKWTNSLTTYDHKPSETVKKMEGAYGYTADIDVQWPFGFGMSYTTFEYSDIRIDKSEFTSNDNLKISVSVKNTGTMEGMESVLLFSSDLLASVTPDSFRLRGFDKISLKPGESRRVEFSIRARDLAFVNYENRWTLEAGEFEFLIGNQKVKAECKATKLWDNPNI